MQVWEKGRPLSFEAAQQDGARGSVADDDLLHHRRVREMFGGQGTPSSTTVRTTSSWS